MLAFPGGIRIFVAVQPVDMRKQFNGLQLLGHESLETTAIYTEVSIKQLQEVHARCLPTGREEPQTQPSL